MTVSRTTRQTAPIVGGSGVPRAASVGAARMAAVLFCILAAFHVALVLGAPWGKYTQGGGTSGTLATSGRIVAGGSFVLAMVMAGAILSRVGQGPLRRLPARVTTVLTWLMTAYAVVGVILNLITRSTAERAVWAPVSIVLLVLIAFVMVTTHRRRRPRGAGR